jgi:hypothetical protein
MKSILPNAKNLPAHYMYDIKLRPKQIRGPKDIHMTTYHTLTIAHLHGNILMMTLFMKKEEKKKRRCSDP